MVCTYTVFLHGEAENTTFAIACRERKWYFHPVRQKIQLFKKFNEVTKTNIKNIYKYIFSIKPSYHHGN